MRRALIGSAVMDHVWQIGHLGPPENEMLEAYTTLGYLAGKTERARLLTAVVTAVVYRDPGLLAKAVTTLYVLRRSRDAEHRCGMERGGSARARLVLSPHP